MYLLLPPLGLDLHLLKLRLNPPRAFQLVFLALLPPLIDFVLDLQLGLLLLVLDEVLVLPLVGDVELLVAEVEVDEALPECSPLVLEFHVFVALLVKFGLLVLDLA